MYLDRYVGQIANVDEVARHEIVVILTIECLQVRIIVSVTSTYRRR